MTPLSMPSHSSAKLAQAFNGAVAAFKAGKLGEAEQLCQQIVSVQRDHFDALHVLGVVQAAAGKLDLALASYNRALTVQPNHPDALNNRGSTQLALNQLDAALASYDRALALRPNFVEGLSNRGCVLEKAGRLEEALESQDRALALRPDFVDALYNRGNVLKTMKRHDEALASYDRAIALRPGFANAHNNRGQVLREMLRFPEALESYDRALALQPHHIMAHCNSASLRLLLGDFTRGWADYEWRWLKESIVLSNRAFPQPIWRGGDIAGKTILLHTEQGLGDTIQFCRYVPLVAARGARVILEVQKPLQGLLRGLGSGVDVIAKGEALPAFDLHCPLLSLPLAFGTGLDSIPSSNAYLGAAEPYLEKWRARLDALRRPRVGLVWSGSLGHERDRDRSIGLGALLPSLDARVSLVSLQKEIRAEDAAMLAERSDILNIGGKFDDFCDTAAAIAQLDLVISVDTSVAHLAGAVGVPVWILITHVPDWRWLLGRDDSLWYPSARLFRQPKIGDWDSAIARVADALCAFVESRRQ